MRKKIVAIHQPDFLPWLGFFYKINKADVFVIYTTCRKDSKLGWTKRVKIKKENDSQWLGFSVQKVNKDNLGLYPKLYEHKFTNFNKDRLMHLRIIEAQYRRTPFFTEIFEVIENIYSYKSDYLVDFNINAIKNIFNLLNITPEIIDSRELDVNSVSNEANAELTKKAGGNTYLSGDGSGDYLDLSIYCNYGVEVDFSNFKHPVYPQTTEPFIAGLSIIDGLMNVGIEGVKKIISEESK